MPEGHRRAAGALDLVVSDYISYLRVNLVGNLPDSASHFGSPSSSRFPDSFNPTGATLDDSFSAHSSRFPTAAVASLTEPGDRICREVGVPKKASAQDAQLLVQLCRVRSEEEMREAHSWWRNRFWPKNVTDYLKVETALGARENIWLQQVVSYWGMAASFVLEGTLSDEKAIMGSSKGLARLRRMAKRQAASRKTAMRRLKETH